jgi:hypothetical protein
LQRLADDVEKRGSDHMHLMTEDWGGRELSSEAQSTTANLLSQVKVLGWKPR